MSASDYRCGHVDCSEPAAAVRVMPRTGAIYGDCAVHLHRLEPGERWVHPPADDTTLPHYTETRNRVS